MSLQLQSNMCTATESMRLEEKEIIYWQREENDTEIINIGEPVDGNGAAMKKELQVVLALLLRYQITPMNLAQYAHFKQHRWRQVTDSCKIKEAL